MKVLTYKDLDIDRAGAGFAKVKAALEADNFAAAKVKKLSDGDYYRAELDYRDRLLFKLVRYQGESYALLLEVIENHAYDKSRFLRGARIDDSKIPPLTDAAGECAHAQVVPYLHPARATFHVLDKVLSFDDAQDAIYRLPLPLILIGSAGSGKTALTLEKLKELTGDILYVTLSPFLTQHARNLYFAHGFERDDQNIDFFAYRELLEALQVPSGKEVDFAAFRAWYARHQRGQRAVDAHRLYEEIKGVITGAQADSPYLSREEYLALGVRQSIFLPDDREAIYELFQKYLAWLSDAKLYDGNVLSHGYLKLAQPKYDFVVVDEVQDLTRIQLALILRCLKVPAHFLLCGDANQIVHPNFFSWSNIKSFFYHADLPESDRLTQILVANYRNAPAVTNIANQLLRIKQQRFGSIDKESNYLVDAVAGGDGTVELLSADATILKDLNDKTRQSTRFAVVVLRDEHKAAAQAIFATPLIFSIHEAKGLEYENVILFNCVTSERQQFNAIIEGVDADALAGDLRFARAKDKSDKTSEVYKFFINALYVAMTRAVRNLYIVEQDTRHGLLRLLGLQQRASKLEIKQQTSSIEEWQHEARKLELQGKQEQADGIRTRVLHARPVPWDVLDDAGVRRLHDQAFSASGVSSKARQLVLEYAAFYDEPNVAARLESHGHKTARNFASQIPHLTKKYLTVYEARAIHAVVTETERYGVDFRNRFNFTPLMLAVRCGNVALIEALLKRGANPELTDNYGRSAFHLALGRAFIDQRYASWSLGTVYGLLAPAATSVQIDGRLIKLDATISEFFLLNAMIAQFHRKFNYPTRFGLGGFATADFTDAVAPFPENVLRADRKRRAYLSGVLSRNEVNRDYAYNRRLFARVTQGYYVLNPKLELKVADAWVSVGDLLNIRLMVQAAPHRGDSFKSFFATA